MAPGTRVPVQARGGVPRRLAGLKEARDKWLSAQVQKWVRAIETFAGVARRYPQTAYAGVTKSLQMEWTYLMRVTDRAQDSFAPIEEALERAFLPALLAEPEAAVAEKRPLLALLVRQAGLGIPNPVTSADGC